MHPSMDQLAAAVGRGLDDPEVLALFQTLPVTAARRKQGRTDLNGLRSLGCKADGYEVNVVKKRIVTVFLYVEPKDGFASYRGTLVAGLSPTDGRPEVLRKLGPPTRSGPPDAGTVPWDRFDSDAACVWVGYGAAGLRMLSVMAPDTAP